MFEIDKNVPMKKRNQYPWDQMEIGDSFLIPWGNGYQPDEEKAARGTVGARNYRTPDAKYSCRKVDDGMRIWRVA